jgi:RND family efflux transporter MFP subunit
MQAEGRLEAARAELQLRQERLCALQELLPRGSARLEEVERARADVEIATAQLRAARDELSVKRLEYERVVQLWQRRTVRSPLTGVVAARFKEEGEFIGPNDPQLLTIMQLDPLLATFAVPSRQAREFCEGQSVQVRLPEAGEVVDGSVHHVAPVIDGRSGTMRVEVRVDNTEQRFLSGEACSLLLGEELVEDGQ